jgi:hypothetical protein
LKEFRGSFGFFLYGMLQGPFDPSQRPVGSSGIVWNPYYGVHLKRFEAIQKKFFKIRVAYTGMEPRYRTASVLSKEPFD